MELGHSWSVSACHSLVVRGRREMAGWPKGERELRMYIIFILGHHVGEKCTHTHELEATTGFNLENLHMMAEELSLEQRSEGWSALRLRLDCSIASA